MCIRDRTEMNRMVASIISAMVSDPRFADAIKAKIGSAVDTNDLETVSYTHLPWKVRLQLRRSGGKGCPLRGSISDRKKAGRRCGYAPVSYTHLKSVLRIKLRLVSMMICRVGQGMAKGCTNSFCVPFSCCLLYTSYEAGCAPGNE